MLNFFFSVKKLLTLKEGLALVVLLLRTGGLFWLLDAILKVFIFWVFRKWGH